MCTKSTWGQRDKDKAGEGPKSLLTGGLSIPSYLKAIELHTVLLRNVQGVTP